jgi:cytochrome c-type biogenesis protein
MNWATGVGEWLPLGYAFGAGMVSTANPCGFAMLPAYLSLFLRTGEDGLGRRSPLVRIGNAYYVGLMVTLGFVVLFGAVGIVISAGGQFLVEAMPWAGLFNGVTLAVIGLLMFSGRHLYSGLATRWAARIQTTHGDNPWSFFTFGIAYAIASLSCTLPIFLVVTGSSIAVDGYLAGFVQFISYALGMGFVIVLLTIGMTIFKIAAVTPFQMASHYVDRISAALILMMGSYLMYYWLTKGNLLAQFT